MVQMASDWFEVQGDGFSSARSALEAGLEALSAPAFVLSGAGEVLKSNERGRSLLLREAGLEGTLRAAAAGTRAALGLELVPLQGHASPGFLAIVSESVRELGRGIQEVATSSAIGEARVRWKLTARQSEVLALVAQGFTNAAVAGTLGITQSTVEFHLSAIFDKAGVSNRATLIAQVHDLPTAFPLAAVEKAR